MKRQIDTLTDLNETLPDQRVKKATIVDQFSKFSYFLGTIWGLT